LVAAQERDQKRKTVDQPRGRAKPGKIPALSPIVAGIVIEGLAESVCGTRNGGTALGINVASILRGRVIQSGEFGIWRRRTSGPAPNLPTGNDGSLPVDLRGWLVQRWRSAYEICFVDRRLPWSGYLMEAANNPHSLFAPLADPEAVTLLYSVPWSRSSSHPRNVR
jgi:hypothetical protein